MLPATTDRVQIHTAEKTQAAIRQQTHENVAHYARLGPEAIEQRLQELDHEWDIERVLEANAAGLALSGLTLGVTVDRKFLILPGLVMGFLLQHALQGWCPPVPIFRRLGVRTASEIAAERYALKALRGDFDAVADHENGRHSIEEALDAVKET